MLYTATVPSARPAASMCGCFEWMSTHMTPLLVAQRYSGNDGFLREKTHT